MIAPDSGSLTRCYGGTSIENQKVHFFVCEGWRGVPRSNEAAEVFFIGIDELCLISIEKERVLLEKHLKK